MFERLDREFRGRGKTYIGYDLGAGYGEISVFTEHDLNPVTLLSRKDATVFHFPCMLVKYKGRFYTGFEAESLSGEDGAFVFEDLLEIAMNQPTIVVDGERFDTGYLLSVFLKLTLVLPESYGKVEKAGGIIFTTYIDEDPALQAKVHEVLLKAAGQIFGKKTKLFLQTRSESIYYFLMHQDESLYTEDTLICDYQKDYLKTYYVQKHGVKAPFSVSVERTDYPDMPLFKIRSEELTIADAIRTADDTFYQVVEDIERKCSFGLSYMIGDGFKGSWMDQSLMKLCEHGRVFQGNNLYSLGACYGLRQVIEASPVLEDYVYFGRQDNPYDIGIYCHKQGFLRESKQLDYISIFERGCSLDGCKKVLYLLPEEDDELLIEVKAISDMEPRNIAIQLGAFPIRKVGQSKLKLYAELKDKQTLYISVEDIGLGQLVPGSKKIMEETFILE